jgi:hypothetical protein
MKGQRDDLLGWDFGAYIRAAAQEMIAGGPHAELRRRQAAAEYRYDLQHEMMCLVFQERSDPPVWRIETLQPGPGGMGIVVARDADERFLVPELRTTLMHKLVVHGVAKDKAEARSMACKMRIVVADTLRLRNSERHEGERGSRGDVR